MPVSQPLHLSNLVLDRIARERATAAGINSNRTSNDISTEFRDEQSYSNGTTCHDGSASAPAGSGTPKEEAMVTWRSLPHKRQLAILTFARLSEPLVQTSLQSYMFYQLKSFDQSLPDSTIASQAGIMQGSFTAAQFFTAMLWGRIADSDRAGRKMVLMIGLLGTRTTWAWLFGFIRDMMLTLS